IIFFFFFFFQAEDGIRDKLVTGVQTCALPIYGLPSDADVTATNPPLFYCRLADKRGADSSRLHRRRWADRAVASPGGALLSSGEIGRASCRERVYIAVVAVV